MRRGGRLYATCSIAKTAKQRRVSYYFPAEKIEQLDQQDDDDRRLEKEGAALIELLDHEVIKVFGGLELARDEIFIVRHAHLGCGHPIESCRKHVAEKFDGIVGMLGQLGHFKQNGMQICG